MEKYLMWLYIINSVLIINHEIESAYWQEWKLFRLPGGISGFLLLHFPLLFAIIYGLIEVYNKTFTGMIISIALSAGGIFAFIIHTYFIKKGDEGFKLVVSQFILYSTLTVSIAQMALTLIVLAR